jgi:pilus assembly protein CpaB
MNRTRLLMIGVLAVALGFLASVYVYKTLQGKSGGGGPPGADVMVAANDLQVGARVEERDVKIIRIPASDLPPNAPRKKSDVIGHGVILPIAKGQFILPNHLAEENAVNEVVSVAGFVTPGTRVDVLLTGNPSSSGDQETTTVLQNVLVLASGHTLERNASGEAQNTAVITLLVTPDDAQRLTLASSEGHIQLALRNPLDTRQDEVPAANSRGLFKGSAAPVPAVTHSTVKRVVPVKATPAPPANTGFSVEVYQGDRKADIVKCSDDGCEGK